MSQGQWLLSETRAESPGLQVWDSLFSYWGLGGVKALAGFRLGGGGGEMVYFG